MKIIALLLIFVVATVGCSARPEASQEKTEMDKLCECFEANTSYTNQVNLEQDSVKRNKIVVSHAERLKECRTLATKLGETMEKMPEEEQIRNQESFENSCSAYKEFIDNNI
jgi:hypothetical protein